MDNCSDLTGVCLVWTCQIIEDLLNCYNYLNLAYRFRNLPTYITLQPSLLAY